MKNRAFLLFALCVMTGCEDFGTDPYAGLEVLPEVRFSQTNYCQTAIRQRIPDRTLLSRFSETYAGRYSDELKASLVQYIIHRAKQAGLDGHEAQACIQATGQLEAGCCVLPYLAERAKYDSLDAWIYEFTWGYNGGFGHFRCFVMDARTQDTLFYESCK
jgi:hypothetical protein